MRHTDITRTACILLKSSAATQAQKMGAAAKKYILDDLTKQTAETADECQSDFPSTPYKSFHVML